MITAGIQALTIIIMEEVIIKRKYYVNISTRESVLVDIGVIMTTDV